MIISVKVSTRTKKLELIPLSDVSFKAKLTAPPVKNAANKQLIELLAEHFKVPKSKISIKAGKTISNKLIKIEN